MTKSLSSTQKVLNIWAIILIIWSLYRTRFIFPEWFDELVAKPLVFILPVYFYILRIDKKDFFSSIWFKKKTIVKDIGLGLGIAVILFLTAFISNYIKDKNFSFNSQKLIFYFFLTLATAISEEILSRGFVLKKLYEESNNIYSSSFIASILFFILHIPILFTNAKITGKFLLFFMMTDIILGLVNSFIFIQRKSISLPILIHAFYNLALILYV